MSSWTLEDSEFWYQEEMFCTGILRADKLKGLALDGLLLLVLFMTVPLLAA